MIIVSSISLSTMLSNNLLIPYGFIGSLENVSQENSKRILNNEKIGYSLIIASYAIYRIFVLDSLFSIGLVAFVVIAQLAYFFLVRFLI
jgi:hypothetical protein